MPITVQGIYACAAVRDFAAGLAFYTKLMGRAPDDQPFPGMAQWRNMGAAGVQLWESPDDAGHARMTIVVPVMAVERARLKAEGIEPEPDQVGDWGVVAQLIDPEGNRITLAEPPKGFPG
ncbi:MAG: VOC family protein [Candidatus Devosia phytovorans]|uniref:VOC family protein n=1 Tax=Candidatus Devosia phytovorans TaxID=3121372 RepID=A0AAJ5VVE8_9HYPH|nr:VOC family protein [Devosia sp.]WEK04262.1 MAG: VOC family protein [Devosia sp.]